MDNIGVPSTPPPTPSTSTEDVLSDFEDGISFDGLAQASNRPVNFSSGGLRPLASAEHHDAARGRSQPPIQVEIPLSKADKTHANLVTKYAADRAVALSSYPGYPELDNEKDEKIINNFIDFSIKNDDSGHPFFVVSLPYRSEVGGIYSNLTTHINSKLENYKPDDKSDAAPIVQYSFPSESNNQSLEDIIFLHDLFKTKKKAGIVLRNIFEAANDYIFMLTYDSNKEKNDTNENQVRQQTLAVALSIYRLADFLKTARYPDFSADDINDIINDFPNLNRLGQAVDSWVNQSAMATTPQY